MMCDMRIVRLTIFLFVCADLFPQSNSPKSMPEDVAIFAVLRDGATFSVDPVVIVHYGPDQRFKTIPALNSPLPSRDWTEADFDKFEAAFYKPATQLSMFYGGQKVGTATVLSSNLDGRDGGCIDLSATVSSSTSATALLAASTKSEIPGHVSTRRAGTPMEISTLRQLAVQRLAEEGLDKQLIQHGRMRQVISAELRHGVGRAIVGRFDVASKRAIYQLFVVAERDGRQYRLTLANLVVQRDLEDGTDKAERDYVDQLDIDGDGQDELITKTAHYESWGYDVWKFYVGHHLWSHKYSALVSGC